MQPSFETPGQPEVAAPRLPDGTEFLDNQVAGHLLDLTHAKVGMLRGPDGKVFKPIVKPNLGDNEIAFYENLTVSSNPIDMEIQRFTPTYYGTKEMRIFDKRVKFLELEDITDGMSEPCVMDIKVGQRTWDPEATPEKRASEERKYVESKKAYGFCIPGYQVYKLPSVTLLRSSKDEGKKLNSKTLVEALQTFLNGNANRPPCRELVVRLLSILWKILTLFREQRRYHFYSSSLLIAYDAKRLRHLIHRQLNNSFAESLLRVPIRRTYSARSLNALNKVGHSPLASPNHVTSPFSFPRPGSPRLDYSSKAGSLSPTSPRLDSPSRSPKVHRAIDRLQRLKRSISLQNCELLPEKSGTDFRNDPFKCGSGSEPRSPTKRLPEVQVHKLCRTHSYSNNFDADIIEMKEDYAAILSELSSSSEAKQNWVRVYMIDFAHVFPAENGELDNNYLEGIDSLIKLLEGFIK